MTIALSKRLSKNIRVYASILKPKKVNINYLYIKEENLQVKYRQADDPTSRSSHLFTRVRCFLALMQGRDTCFIKFFVQRVINITEMSCIFVVQRGLCFSNGF